MAHFAEINENNEVIRVIVVANEELLDGNGDEQESLGVAFCSQLFGGTWKQTSYNNNFRGNYAGIGYTYDSDLDAFIPQQPFSSWTLNTDTYQWEAPTPRPSSEDGTMYLWNESDLSWQLI